MAANHTPLRTPVPDTDSAQVPPELVRAHLDSLLASSALQSSRRCRDLLSYIVNKVLDGHASEIKERALGEDVFGRPGYEPAEQNLVRVTANELRKRLAACYEEHTTGVRIELPRGTYVPVFSMVREPEQSVALPETVPPEATSAAEVRGYSAKLAVLAGMLVAVVAVAGAFVWWPRPSAEAGFWQPVLASGKPAVVWTAGGGAIVSAEGLAALQKYEDSTVPYSVNLRPNDVVLVDQVIGYGHTAGIARVMSWLSAHSSPAQLRLGRWATPTDMTENPLILFGALNNPWTVDMNRDLRFQVKWMTGQVCVMDKSTGGCRWSIPDYKKRGYDVSVDYGIVTRVVDQLTRQVRVSIGGICHYSSQAGAEFVTTPRYWEEIERTAPKGWQRMNLQAVIETRVVQKSPQSPKVLAVHFW